MMTSLCYDQLQALPLVFEWSGVEGKASGDRRQFLLLPGLARPVNDYIIVEKLFIIVDLGTMQRL
jgi:hypothetical protein